MNKCFKDVLKNKNSHSHIFTDIYIKNRWGNGSGVGASISFNEEYISFLKQWIKNNNIKTIVDIGCGDWQFSKVLYDDDIQYLGIDCVPTIIEKNISLYKKNNIDFLCIDILENLEAIVTSDLYIIKDVFQHWTNREILFFLNTWKRTKKSKFLLSVNCSFSDMQDQTKYKDKDLKKSGIIMRPLSKSHTVFDEMNISSIFRYKTKEVCLICQ